MTNFNLCNTDYLRSDQYKDSTNLDARAYLHDHFSINRIGLQRWIFDQILEFEVQKILDIGCGPGYLWVQNHTRVPEPWGIALADISWGMLKEAKERMSDRPFRLSYTVCDAQALAYPDHSFDIIIANHMFYHLPDLERALTEMQRVLRSSGRLVCTTNSTNHMKELFTMLRSVRLAPFHWSEDGVTHPPFNLKNGAQLLRKRFSAVEVRPYEDSLRVTEVEPLLKYMLSVAGIREAVARNPERLERLRTQLHEELGLRGFIHITKETGLFVAS